MTTAGGGEPADSALEPLEIAVGHVLERRRRRAHRTRADASTARQALEDAILPSLTSGRASVSFSGGRDSSLILAVATHVARREGLPKPVAITMRHEDEGAQETDWQELVVAHLGIEDWVRVEVGETMDLLGPEPAALLARTGVQSPPNAYLHLPVVAAAPAGTVLTGVGGDELLSPASERLRHVVFHGMRPQPRDLLRLGFAVAPRSVRRRVLRRRDDRPAPWLRPAARAEVMDRLAGSAARERLRWDRELAAFVHSRSVRLGRQALGAVGTDRGVQVATPLFDPRFAAAWAGTAGPGGPRSRTDSMRILAGDLLPDAVLARTTKAHFAAMVWGPAFRRFVAGWDPATLAPSVANLVDVDRVVEQWRSDVPWFGTMMLAQQAWLDERRST